MTMKVGMGHFQSEGDKLISDENYAKRNQIIEAQELYKIVKDETYGRHLVAAKDIKAGETIFIDEPLTMGPMCATGVEPCCLTCYKVVISSKFTCKCCGWPMCDQKCAQHPTHANQECKLFKEHGVKVDAINFDYAGEEPMYSVISVLRAISLQTKNPERWSLLWSLMSHNQHRRKNGYWNKRHDLVIKLIREDLGMREISTHSIDTVMGIFLVNDFEITQPARDEEGNLSSTCSLSTVASKSNIRGLFGLASIPNHNCVCNTVHTFLGDGTYSMVVRASRDIKIDEDITHSYVDPLEPIFIRQELLTIGKFFQCQCIRCKEKSELGTNSSACICPLCRKGLLLPTDMSDICSDWLCNNCKASQAATKISRIYNAIKAKADDLEYDPRNPETCAITKHEEFLKKYGQVLYKSHVLIITVKYNLAKMYGRMEQFKADHLTDKQLKRKLELCEEVLAVFDKIMPGCNRMRGIILYELHLPLVMLASRALEAGPGGGMDAKAIKNNIKRGLDCLIQSIAILKYEPKGSFENQIVEASSDSVEEMKTWYETLSKVLK